MSINEALAPYQVFPKTPKQVFAGVEIDATVFLAFPDEQTAIAALIEAGLAKSDGQTTVYAPGVDFMGGSQKELDAKQNYEAVKAHAGVLVNLIL